MNAPPVTRFRRARSRYLGAGLLLICGVALSGWLLNAWLTRPGYLPLSPVSEAVPVTDDPDQLFELAVRRMQRRDYQAALDLWHRMLLLDADSPQIQVNMGFTLYELGRFDAARDFFGAAVERNPFQANAYYGLALVSEQAGDLDSALGAMRSYIHLAGPDEDPRFVRRARAAMWEWEARRAEAGNPGTAAEGAVQPAQ